MESFPSKIKQVWEWNFYSEMLCINDKLNTYNSIALDTEFPGFLHQTPRYASEEKVYEDLEYNVGNTKIVQLGLTLFDDEGNIGGTWQINFYNFLVKKGRHVQSSIKSLGDIDNVEKEKNDHSAKKRQRRRDAVDMLDFSIAFNEILSNHKNLKWVTFHGLYDFAYLWRLLSRQDLPNSTSEFSIMLARVFGSVYDVKYMARFCEGLMDGELGLERLSKILDVERLGRAHQAGSDSLLTASVFLKMKTVYGFDEECFMGFLYGISTRVQIPRLVLVRFDVPTKCNIMPLSCTAMSMSNDLPLLGDHIIMQHPCNMMLVPVPF